MGKDRPLMLYILILFYILRKKILCVKKMSIKKFKGKNVILTGILMVLFFGNLLLSITASSDDKIDISGDTDQRRVNANERTTLRFRQRTQLTFSSNKNLDVNIECDAKNIGDKDFELELESSEDLQLNMTCTEEEKELGLLKGNTYQPRNRERHRFLEGFVVSMECNGTFEAKLKMKATEENRLGTWAYYDESSEEWVPVETTEKNGYLVAETDHFSVWTVLLPEIDYTLLILIGMVLGAIVLVGITIVFIKRKEK